MSRVNIVDLLLRHHVGTNGQMYDCPTRAACIAGIKWAFTWDLRTGIMNHNSLLNLL